MSEVVSLKPKEVDFMKSRYVWIGLFVVGMLMGACSRSGKDQKAVKVEGLTAEPLPPLVVVIPKGTTHSFWQSVKAGAEKAAKETGVRFIWQGPQREDDRDAQIAVVQNAVSRNADAIVLAPLDDEALVGPVAMAVKRGIKVVIIDSALRYDDTSSFVATDNVQGGKLCAKRLAEVMGGKGSIIMLRYAEGSASTTSREEGFLSGLQEYGPGMTILSATQYAGATIESALKVAQNLLNLYPNVEGVFCPNESSTQGMLRALEIAGKTKQVKLVGFDANESMIGSMRDGDVCGLALQDPYRMGYVGVSMALKAIRGSTVEKRVDTGVIMVTTNNLDTPEVQKLLHPESR